jgi:D-mannonate dehydratase
MDEAWSVAGLSRLRETVESHGITLDMVPLPMSSAEITRAEMPAIYLCQSHVPQVEGVDSNQGFAFAFGYIKALIAAVSAGG